MQLQVCVLLALLCASATAATSYQFGTYYRPFSADSLWNCKPVDPVFADASIYRVNTSDFFPTIAQGSYSTGMFLATVTDTPQTVYGTSSSGLWNVDAMEYQNNITLPHWPASALPATGSDGHCDIVDPTTGMLHSFWQLKKSNTTGNWVAAQYAWGYLAGTGWGDPAHYYQGARAAGVPTSGGIIRSHEAIDGTDVYPHALALSLTFNSLARTDRGFIYPATSADDSYTANSGFIPEGALLMLPADYNYSGVASLQLRKVAETLKQYGAYVVDRNQGTPFAIYVENGAKFSLSNATGWDNAVAAELQRMRANLRMVNSTLTNFVDGNGEPLKPRTNVNILSMRGPKTWERTSGDGTAKFDTWSQSLVFTESNQTTNYRNTNGLGLNRVYWGSLKAGQQYNFTVFATGGARLQINVMTSNGSKETQNFTSGYLGDGQVTTFTHPPGGYIYILASKPAGPAASLRGMIYVPDGTGLPTQRPTVPPSETTSTPGGTTANTPGATTQGTTSAGVDSSALSNMVIPVALIAGLLFAVLM